MSELIRIICDREHPGNLQLIGVGASAPFKSMNDIYKSGGVIEDLKVEDGVIYQVRHQDMDKFRKVMSQVEELNSMAKYRPEIRPSYSFPEVACLDIVKRYGRDMHPRRFPKMSETEKDKFRRIVRTEYPYCIVGGFSKRFY